MNVKSFAKKIARRFLRKSGDTIGTLANKARRFEESLDDASLAHLAHYYSELRTDPESYKETELPWIAAGIGAAVISRVMGFRLYDVQLFGAIAASKNQVIEMQTGEGKTIVCALTAMIRSVQDQSIHVATTNDYLAERDHEVARKLFEQLGITSGVITTTTGSETSRAIYRNQIVYAAGPTFGFDFLRDQLTLRKRQSQGLGRELLSHFNGDTIDSILIQPLRETVIIDEADSVLVDESTTPLLLSGPDHSTDPKVLAFSFYQARKIAMELTESTHFDISVKDRRVDLTSAGFELSHESLEKIGRLKLTHPWSQYIEQAIFAERFLSSGEHYIVQDEKVKLVDQFTGRIFDDRTLSDGLHQAVEAKEQLEIGPPSCPLARITRQSFFRMYDNLCGMSGTVSGCDQELRHFYGISSTTVRPNRKSQRRKLPSRYFCDSQTKVAAITEETIETSSKGQPILIGTKTIAESIDISKSLTLAGVDCVLLNGLQNMEEAEIVQKAGQPHAITIATNMAGRGTDIKIVPECLSTGGLHVICSQHNDSIRIDRQLVGRAARQGQPGTYRFFVSAEDELFEKQGEQIVKQIKAGSDANGECHEDFSNQIEQLQKASEKDSFDTRKRLVDYDKWMDGIRETVAATEKSQ